MKSARNQYFQTLRGILIIFVISIHCVTGFGYDVASWNYDMYIIVRNLIGIAVPVFFAVSGYFSNNDRKNKILDVKLLLPFLIWSVLYSIGERFWTVKGLLKIVTGQSESHLYFIFVLLQIRFLLPIIKKLNKHIVDFCVIAMTVLWYGLFYLTSVFGVFAIPQSVPLSSFFPAWILYWWIGYRMKDEGVTKKAKRKFIPIMCIVLFVLAVSESYLYTFSESIMASPVSQLRISNLLFCTCVCMGIFCFKKETSSNLISKIGDVSYGIYYVHFFIIKIGLHGIENYLGNVWIVVNVVQVIIVLCISVGIIKVCRLICGDRIAGKFLGF